LTDHRWPKLLISRTQTNRGCPALCAVCKGRVPRTHTPRGSYRRTKVVSAASLPALAKNARTGHPLNRWRTRTSSESLGHPPTDATRDVDADFDREGHGLQSCRKAPPKIKPGVSHREPHSSPEAANVPPILISGLSSRATRGTLVSAYTTPARVGRTLLSDAVDVPLLLILIPRRKLGRTTKARSNVEERRFKRRVERPRINPASAAAGPPPSLRLAPFAVFIETNALTGYRMQRDVALEDRVNALPT